MNAIASLPIPGRVRPFEKTQAPTPAWLRLIVGRDLAPTREEYATMGNALWDGDPAMDELTDWMFSISPRDSRALFTKALNEGVGSIPDCPEPLRKFFKTVDTLPAWLDFSLIDDAIRFIHGTGLASPYVLRDLALMGGYLLSGFNQALLMTGGLNKSASQRLAETGQWWMECTEPDGLRRFGSGFKSTIHVRLIHAMVRRSLNKRDDWDSTQWGAPLSQVDMISTYLGFCVVMLGGLRKIGIPVTPHESKAVMHLWSYACWLMGVDERWLCFTESEGIVLLNHTIMTQSKPDHTSQELAIALANEPLERKFEHFQSLRRKLEYHQHLSVSHFFLGTQKMKQLGLPEHVNSWFPLLSIGPRLVSYTTHRFVPGRRKKLEATGRTAQKTKLRSMFGEKEQRVMQPNKGHPAYV
jgi:hypothetical protein